MNKISFLLAFFTLLKVNAQVPPADLLLGLHNIENSSINSITDPIKGTLLYNSTKNSVYVNTTGTPTGWNAIGLDNLGNHTAIQNFNTNNKWISNDGSNNGLFLNTDGYLGIGTNNPARELHINNGNIRIDRTENSSSFILHRKDSNEAPLKTFYLGVDASGVNDGRFFISDLEHNIIGHGIERLSINNTGNIGLGNPNPNVRLDVYGSIKYTGTLTNASDLKLKKNIKQLSYSLYKIKKLKPVSYQYKSDEFPKYNFNKETQLGFIAQEVEKVIPELVSENGDGFKQLNYIGLVPLLIKSVQEQQTMIEKQQNLIDSLTKKIEKIEVALF